MKRVLVLVAIVVAYCLSVPICSALKAAEVRGKVVDASGAAIANAAVTLTDLATNTVINGTTGPDGRFVLNNVAPHPQLISVEKSGFETFTQRISASATTTASITATLNVATLAESVVVRGTVDPEAKPVPTRDDVMLTPETLRVLDRKQLDAGGPLAGGAQMIQSTPGANVIGYGETGATKYTVLLNGVQQGWAGENQGFTAPGSLGITFDGVPVGDPATGLWQSATMPQNLVMQDLAVTYGPGQPMNRWYNSVGGSVEFTPIQPTVDRHLGVALTEGPYGQQNFAFVGNSGKFKGWSTVAGGGLGRGDDYRPAPDGFGNPAKDGSVFGKTLKTFDAGSLAFSAFYAKAGGYRSQVIPTTDVGLVEPGSGIHYSQPSSGFYSSLPFADYNKYDTNEMFLTYARENLYLSKNVTLQNSTWYNHIRRFHRRESPALDAGGQMDEWNNPFSNILGDQANMSVVLPLNTVDFGGFDTLYRSPALGGGGGMFQSVDPSYYILAEGKYSQGGVKVHFVHAPGLGNFIAGVNYFHLNYTNQELDYETALGVTGTDGGNSVYKGADLFFDADPRSNIHIFLNFAGESANFTNYVTGGNTASCGTPSNPAAGCAFYNNLPVSYVPNFTLNAGVYYGIQHNHHEIIEPRYWIESTGSRSLWSNNTGMPTNQTMPSYTVSNMSFVAPISFQEKQSINLRLDLLNLANSRYNENEYISSGGYFSGLFPTSNYPTGYINAYPGAPRAIYGTISYQF
jgi:hypothetical protein